MASIKEALDDSISDNLVYVKYIIWAIPVFVTYLSFAQGNINAFWIIGTITALLLLGLMVQCTHNVRNGNNYILPSNNIQDFLTTIFKSVFAVCPVVALGLFIGGFLVNINIPIPINNIQLIYSVIVWAIIGSIIITSFVLFARTKHIKDAYNFKLISATCIDILIAIIFFIPQILIVNGLFLGVIAYVFSIFWDLNCIPFVFICSIALVQNVVITSSYLAQIEYEVVQDR